MLSPSGRAFAAALALLTLAACGDSAAERTDETAENPNRAEAGSVAYASAEALCAAIHTGALDVAAQATADVIRQAAEWSESELFADDTACEYTAGDAWLDVEIDTSGGAPYAVSAAVRTSYDEAAGLGEDAGLGGETGEGGFSVDYAAMTVEGRWRSTDDPSVEVEFGPGTFRESYDGETLTDGSVQFSEACPGLDREAASGALVPFAFSVSGAERMCYTVVEADGETLAYALAGGRGNTLRFTRVD